MCNSLINAERSVGHPFFFFFAAAAAAVFLSIMSHSEESENTEMEKLRWSVAVSEIGYFYFYGCLRGKALEILGLQLFVSTVKISIFLTSWKAQKAILCLEN